MRMSQGTLDQAIELAKQRWAKLHSFDLEQSQWDELFDEYRAGDVLTAIAKTRGTHSQAPERVFSSLIYWLNRLAEERREATSWPPPDVHQL